MLSQKDSAHRLERRKRKGEKKNEKANQGLF
jgi:hypothetical protein